MTSKPSNPLASIFGNREASSSSSAHKKPLTALAARSSSLIHTSSLPSPARAHLPSPPSPFPTVVQAREEEKSKRTFSHVSWLPDVMVRAPFQRAKSALRWREAERRSSSSPSPLPSLPSSLSQRIRGSIIPSIAGPVSTVTLFAILVAGATHVYNLPLRLSNSGESREKAGGRGTSSTSHFVSFTPCQSSRFSLW